MTMKLDTSVKFGYGEIPDAPALFGAAGKMIEVLDAVLVNGYCIRTADSVVVASGVATVNLSAGNPYPKYAVVAISGTSVAALNDEWRIRAVSASAFEFDCPGVPDGTPTGSVSVRMAPAGWEKTYAATNLAAYRSVDPASTGVYLWVDDSDPKNAKVRGYESMTGIESGTNPFPTLAQSALNAYLWGKSSTTDTTPRKWAFCGDGRFFHLCSAFHATSYYACARYQFGDIVCMYPGDAWGITITAHAATAVFAPTTGMTADPNSHEGSSRPRGLGGGYSPTSHRAVCAANFFGHDSVASDTVFAAPVHALTDTITNSPVRGRIPGLLVGRNKTLTDFHTNVIEVGGELLFCVRVSDGSPAPEENTMAFYELAPAVGWR